MQTIYPYLAFDGTCEEAFSFYKNVLGGEYQSLARYRDMPPNDCKKISSDLLDKIMHISLPLSEETMLMGSDISPENGELTKGNNISLFLKVSTKREANTKFKLLSQGGNILMPLQDTFWDSYFGMLKDKFGFTWMLGFNYSE